MNRIPSWALAAGGAVLALAILMPAILWIETEAVIERRYPLPSTTVAALNDARTIARGAHLVAIAGCADCHGRNLEGRWQGDIAPLPLWSSNLRRTAQDMDDGELERAIRYGITPAATSTWAMPSFDYTYMSEADVVAIVSYLRTLKPLGEVRPAPDLDWRARFAIWRGDLVPIAQRTLESSASLDPGPRYDGGRYLARIGCSDCHDTDLTGSGAAPDLDTVARYDRSRFFALLRAGRLADGRISAVMQREAGTRFHALYDYEIEALYDYLAARAKILLPPHRRAMPATDHAAFRTIPPGRRRHGPA